MSFLSFTSPLAHALLTAIFSDNLVFWSLVTTYGSYQIARIVLTRLDGCCTLNRMPLLEKVIEEEEYDDNTPIEEEDEIKEE